MWPYSFKCEREEEHGELCRLGSSSLHSPMSLNPKDFNYIYAVATVEECNENAGCIKQLALPAK